MRCIITRALTVLVLAAVAALPATAQEEPLRDAGLEHEVRALNATLGELVELLRRQLESSNAAVLMQRVQLMTSRIAPLEEELRGARADVDGFQSELDELELSATNFEAQLEREIADGQISEERARSLREQQLPGLEQRREQIGERLWTARQRVIDLEQRLAARRAEIETWEGEIDRVLGLR